MIRTDLRLRFSIDHDAMVHSGYCSASSPYWVVTGSEGGTTKICSEPVPSVEGKCSPRESFQIELVCEAHKVSTWLLLPVTRQGMVFCNSSRKSVTDMQKGHLRTQGLWVFRTWPSYYQGALDRRQHLDGSNRSPEPSSRRPE